jgi:hypothetical protein
VASFQKGHKKVGGRKKGTKNKEKVILDINWEEEDIKELKKAIMELIRKRNPTIIGKLIDKAIANKTPEQEELSDNELTFEDWT